MFVRSLFPSLVSLLRVSTPIRSRAHSISFNPIPFTRPSSASLDSHSLTSPLHIVQPHSLHSSVFCESRLSFAHEPTPNRSIPFPSPHKTSTLLSHSTTFPACPRAEAPVPRDRGDVAVVPHFAGLPKVCKGQGATLTLCSRPVHGFQVHVGCGGAFEPDPRACWRP